MAQRGTRHEAAIAQAVLDRHPVTTLSAEQILATDDSAYGPSAQEVDDAVAAFYAREYKSKRKGRKGKKGGRK
jgi:hypothetical protein